jgi:rubrerythrin
MAEYISREAVINITAETGAWETQNRVRELPAADVQPVKRGKWIENAGYGGWSNSEFKCPECGIMEYKPTNFCPNCGARMDGDTNG